MVEFNLNFRKANIQDSLEIWEILQQAIERRRKDGSRQWQDGYPNPETVKSDIENGVGYVLTDHHKIIGYAAVISNDEPAYNGIEGSWLTEGEFLVIHRVAVSDEFLGKGMARKIFQFIEKIAEEQGIHSIKVDTNFDNPAMLHLLEKLGYVYCGEVLMRGSARKGFEKILI